VVYDSGDEPGRCFCRECSRSKPSFLGSSGNCIRADGNGWEGGMPVAGICGGSRRPLRAPRSGTSASPGVGSAGCSPEFVLSPRPEPRVRTRGYSPRPRWGHAKYIIAGRTLSPSAVRTTYPRCSPAALRGPLARRCQALANGNVQGCGRLTLCWPCSQLSSSPRERRLFMPLSYPFAVLARALCRSIGESSG